MSSLLQDIRVAVRALSTARSFSIIAVTTLAVAIGANTAIFSVVDGVLLRPLPYPDAEQLVTVAAGVLPQAGGGEEAPFSDRGYWHFVNNNRSFATFGAFSAGNIQWPLTNDGPPWRRRRLHTRSAVRPRPPTPARTCWTGGARSCRPGPRISLVSVETRRPNRSAEALAHDPLPVMSQATLWGHASRVPGRGWRGVAPLPLRTPSFPRRRRCADG